MPPFAPCQTLTIVGLKAIGIVCMAWMFFSAAVCTEHAAHTSVGLVLFLSSLSLSSFLSLSLSFSLSLSLSLSSPLSPSLSLSLSLSHLPSHPSSLSLLFLLFFLLSLPIQFSPPLLSLSLSLSHLPSHPSLSLSLSPSLSSSAQKMISHRSSRQGCAMVC